MKKRRKIRKSKNFLINASPKIKMSEFIAEYASDYINMGSDTEERQSYLNSACTAWNIAVLPEHLRKGALKNNLEDIQYIVSLICSLKLHNYQNLQSHSDNPHFHIHFVI